MYSLLLGSFVANKKCPCFEVYSETKCRSESHSLILTYNHMKQQSPASNCYTHIEKHNRHKVALKVVRSMLFRSDETKFFEIGEIFDRSTTERKYIKPNAIGFAVTSGLAMDNRGNFFHTSFSNRFSYHCFLLAVFPSDLPTR